jgi:hypothetical protein
MEEIKRKIPIWERRGQTFAQYQKRQPISGHHLTDQPMTATGINKRWKDILKQEPNPNSITQTKIAMRIAGVRVKDSTRAKIRERREMIKASSEVSNVS